MCLLSLLVAGCPADGEEDPGFFQGDGDELLDDAHSPRALAAGEGVIFFSDEQDGAGALGKLALASGELTQLAGPLGQPPKELVSGGGWVAWIEADAGVGSVSRVAAAGGTSQTLAEGLQDPRGLSADETNLYFVEEQADQIWMVPHALGEPAVLVSGVPAVQATASDGQFVYFVQGYDPPHGALLRVAIPQQPDVAPPAVEELVGGLGAPYELLLVGQEVCWRELVGDLVQCASKTGGQPRQLTAGQGYLPSARPQLVADEGALYLATPDDARRVPLSGGPVQVVARAGEFSSVRALLVIGDTLYWSDGSQLRAIDKTNVVPGSGGPDGGVPPGPGCPSIYDGSYFGQLVYEYDAGDPANPPLTPTVGSVALTVELSCQATSASTTVLTVTHAVADDPTFGCQLAGCTPSFGSVATLPAEAPTSPSNSSQNGQGLVILFPNGSSIVTTNSAGALSVSSDGRTLSNSLDPAITDATWVATPGPGSSGFPPAKQQGAPLTRYQSWTLNKSAR